MIRPRGSVTCAAICAGMAGACGGTVVGPGGPSGIDGGADVSVGGAGGGSGTGGSTGGTSTGGAAGAGGVGGTGGTNDCPGTGGPSMVKLPAGYCIDSTEVTREQYKAWLATNPSTGGQPPYCGFNKTFTPESSCTNYYQMCQGACDNHPQVCVDWCDAFAYCKAVGKRLCGKIGGGANGYDELADASKSQWFNACSSGGQYEFPYGGPYDAQACNNSANGLWTTVKVASYPLCQSSEAGYAGVYDLSGNVWEWEDSCKGSNGSSDACRIRGGAYDAGGVGPGPGPGETMTCAYDAYDNRESLEANTGFRCCAP